MTLVSVMTNGCGCPALGVLDAVRRCISDDDWLDNISGDYISDVGAGRGAPLTVRDPPCRRSQATCILQSSLMWSSLTSDLYARLIAA